MGGMKVHWWRGNRFQRFMPASHAKTPAIPFFQSGEAILWRYQVVAAGFQNRGVVRGGLPGSRLNIQRLEDKASITNLVSNHFRKPLVA